MFNILYNRYIEQIKLQEIQNYNKKHQDYLIRSGKLNNNSSFPTSNDRPQTKKNSYNSIQQTKNKKTQNPRAYPINNEQACSNIGGKQNKGPSNLKQQQRPIKTNFDSHKSGINQRQQNYHSLNQSNHSSQIYNDEQNKNSVIEKNKEQRFIGKQQSKQLAGDLNQFLQQQEDIVLQQCPEGCGRKFRISALEKHVKICQKVFQKKRKAFKVDVVDDQAKKLAAKNSHSDQGAKKEGPNKVPKWKKQSQMLRKGLKVQQKQGDKQGNNNKKVEVEPQEEDDRIQCGGCGRKFNETAAQKHIPSCIKRSKQKK